VDVTRRDRLSLMTHQHRNRRLRVAEVGSKAGEAVPENTRVTTVSTVGSFRVRRAWSDGDEGRAGGPSVLPAPIGCKCWLSVTTSASCIRDISALAVQCSTNSKTEPRSSMT
jgi:hypothetical protein